MGGASIEALVELTKESMGAGEVMGLLTDVGSSSSIVGIVGLLLGQSESRAARLQKLDS